MDSFAHAPAAARSWWALLRNDPARLLPVALFVAAAATILLTFRDYGITWDEQWQYVYGEYIISWYQSLFQDRRALDYWNLKYYGGLFDLIANSAARLSPFDTFETRHLVNAGFALLGVAAAYRIGCYVHGRASGLLAAAFLLLTPMYYGHAFNNAKDIPFAALFTVALYYLVRMVRELPSPRWSLVLKFALAAGLALGVRVGGVLLFFFYCFAVFVWAAQQWWVGRQDIKIRPALRSIAVRFDLAAIVAYCVMLLAWPAAQPHPLTHPLESFRIFGRFPGPTSLFFEGREVATNQVPWYYLTKWMLLTLPEFILAGLLIGVVLVALRARQIQRADPRLSEFAVVAITFAFPVTYAALTRPTLYDGMRHFLFIVPALAVTAAVAWIALLQSLKKTRPLFAILLAASMLFTVRDMIQLHPYEYVYFNRPIGGGLKKAAASYETEYWGNSYREGVSWIAANYAPTNGRRIRVTSCSFPFSTTHFLPKRRFKYVVLGSGEADLFLATTRNKCDRRLEGRTVHVVQRQGVPLLYVKELPAFAPTTSPSEGAGSHLRIRVVGTPRNTARPRVR